MSSLLPGLARHFTTIVSVLAGRAAGLAAWGSAGANGRVRAMSAEVRILALQHQRERSGSCPDLRKFRIIAVPRWSGFAYRLTVMLV